MNTLTFKVTVPQVVDTHTVELPYYCQLSHSTWAILDEKNIIEVNIYKYIDCANIFRKSSLPGEIERFEVETITKEQFLEAYNHALNLITKGL